MTVYVLGSNERLEESTALQWSIGVIELSNTYLLYVSAAVLVGLDRNQGHTRPCKRRRSETHQKPGSKHEWMGSCRFLPPTTMATMA